jgi:hypothetical protein
LKLVLQREIILNNNLNDDDIILSMKVNDILSYLNCLQSSNNIYNVNITVQKKIAFQQNLFEKIYKIKSNIDIFVTLGVEYLNWARTEFSIIIRICIKSSIKFITTFKNS